MGYEMEIRCDGCGDATPSLKMWRNCSDSTATKLGNWIYEHIHCAETYNTTQNIDEELGLKPLTFTRIVEDDELWGINRDLKWRYPISKRTLDYQEPLDGESIIKERLNRIDQAIPVKLEEL